ncbi:MAG: GPP34 family phosphoprotein [Ancrocorticia sp.]|uniref:GPP34 family phosphoprotein n=1 Tax=Ancrocorticia sp. TaxID=2593684 RepID=UPI003F8E147A
MTTLGDLVTVTTDPNGKLQVLVDSDGNYLLAAAALADLIDRGRLTFAPYGPHPQIQVLSYAPVPEPSLTTCLSHLQNKNVSVTDPRNLLRHMYGGPRGHKPIFESLVYEGVLGPALPSLGWKRYPVANPPYREGLLGELYGAFFGPEVPREPIRRIAALLAVGDMKVGSLLDPVLDWPGAKPPGAPDLTGRQREEALGHMRARGHFLAQNDPVAQVALAIVTPEYESPFWTRSRFDGFTTRLGRFR